MATLRGVIAAWDGTTASIRLEGSSAQLVTTTKKAANIASADMIAGRKAMLDTGDHNDPADFVVYAVWV